MVKEIIQAREESEPERWQSDMHEALTETVLQITLQNLYIFF